MSKITKIPISSLKPWKGSKSTGPEQTPVTPKSSESPITPNILTLQDIKNIASKLKAYDNRHELHPDFVSELTLDEITDISTEVSIEDLQNLWTQGKLKETPEQTKAVDKALEDMMKKENISQEEKELWIKISGTKEWTK